MTLPEVIEQFRSAITTAGMTPPDHIEADGKLRRIALDGDKKGKRNGWYVLHVNGSPAGAFGNWKTDERHTWHANGETKFSKEERQKFESQRAAREAKDKRRQEAAAKRAESIWSAAQVCERHDYLNRKNVHSYGLRVAENGNLIIPLRDADGKICTLQFISGDGEKRFLSHGRKRGCYFAIGKPNGTIILAEGYATAASIHEASGQAAAVAFDAGNLKHVAEALHTKYPDTKLIVAADNDESGAGERAAKETGLPYAMPPKTSDDFNDLYLREGAEAVQQVITMIVNSGHHQETETVSFRCFASIEAKPIRWLWTGRIARGKVSMIAGHPGLGKSQITASLAAIVSTGGAWPVDRARSELGNVIFLSAEDDAEDTIRPRLEAAGADLDRCFTLDAVIETDSTGDTVRRAFNLRKDIERLANFIEKIRDVALIVIDPITAYLGDADSHKNAEIRALLSPLSGLAAKHSVAIVCISHFNKAGSNEALLRVTGSLAFVAAARAAFIVARDPGDESRRLFLPAKNNLGTDKSGFAFRVESHQLKNGIDTSRVSWEGVTVDITADEVLAPPVDSEERSAVDEAGEFLSVLLSNVPMSVKRVQQEADDAGHSWATVKRAKKRLGIKAGKEGLRGGWGWRLPTKVLKNTEDAQQENVSTFGNNEHLRRDSETSWSAKL